MSTLITGDKNLWQRQRALHGMADFGLEQVGTGNGYTAKLPQGVMILAIVALVVTAFNAGTTATLTVTGTDNNGGAVTTFVNGVDATSTGSKTVANVPKFYASGCVLAITGAQTGTAATTGRAIVSFSYIQLGVGEAVMG